MTERKLENIKTKIEELQEDKAKLKGVMEDIEDKLEKEYGAETLEDAKDKAAEMESELLKIEKKKERVVKDIEDAVDWEELL